MSRPIHADADKTRQRIIDAAMLRFAERGMDGASVRLIAKDASVSIGMINHYFGSKDKLYETCMARMYDKLAELQPKAVQIVTATTDTADIIRQLVRVGYRFCRQYKTEMRLLIRSIMDRGDFPLPLQAQGQERLLVKVSQLAGPALNLSELRTRNLLQQMAILCGRHAVASERELLLLSMCDNPADAEEVVEDQLVLTALQLCGHSDVPARKPRATEENALPNLRPETAN